MCQELQAQSSQRDRGFHKPCINTSSGRANANHISTDLFPNHRDLALGKQLEERHRPKGLRVSYQGTKGGNIRFNMGIDLGEKVSKKESTETGKKEIYFGLNLINNARYFCGCCSSPRLLKGPPTATDRQAALVTHSTALGWKGQGWRAGHHEQEGVGSTSCTSQRLTTALTAALGSQGKPSN